MRAIRTLLALAAVLTAQAAGAVNFTYTPAADAAQGMPTIVVDYPYLDDHYLGTTFESNWDHSYGEGIFHTTWIQKATLTTDLQGQVIAWTASGGRVFDRYPGTTQAWASSLQGGVFDEWFFWSGPTTHSASAGTWVMSVPEPAPLWTWLAGLTGVGAAATRSRKTLERAKGIEPSS